MDSTAPSARSESAARRVPVIVWLLTLLFAVKAFFSIVGSFLFAFPMGWPLGTIVGVFLVVAGVAYAVIAWRMRFGERIVWLAALIVSVLHQAGLAILDLSLYGEIPSEDYVFIGVTIVVVVLLFLPVTRRFFSR